MRKIIDYFGVKHPFWGAILFWFLIAVVVIILDGIIWADENQSWRELNVGITQSSDQETLLKITEDYSIIHMWCSGKWVSVRKNDIVKMNKQEVRDLMALINLVHITKSSNGMCVIGRKLLPTLKWDK